MATFELVTVLFQGIQDLRTKTESSWNNFLKEILDWPLLIPYLSVMVKWQEGVLQESILDFFILCSSVLPFVRTMVIDENKQYILTNYKVEKNDGKAIDSNHYT